ncbi:MAG: DUF2914 domain-containing protein [Fidelibacterota bacterium]
MNDPTIIPVTIVFLILVTIAIVMGLNKVSYIMVLSYVLYILIVWLSGFNSQNLPTTTPQPMTVTSHPKPVTATNAAVAVTDTVALVTPAPADTIPVKHEYYIPIRLNNLVMTHGIDYRDPVDTVNVFSDSTDYVYCFTAVENQNPYRVPIYHEWRYEGAFFSKIKITVGKSYNWRCWSRVSNVSEWTGQWQVIISDSLGASPDTIRFGVLPKNNNDLIRVP